MYMNIHKMVYDLICCTEVCILRPLGNLLLQHSCQILYFVRLKFKFWNCCHHLPFDNFIHSVTNHSRLAQCENYKNLLFRFLIKFAWNQRYQFSTSFHCLAFSRNIFQGKVKFSFYTTLFVLWFFFFMPPKQSAFLRVFMFWDIIKSPDKFWA